MTAAEALAEAWASIDGKMDAFCRERDDKISIADPACAGHYEGYLAEAESMIERLRKRGFAIVPVEATKQMIAAGDMLTYREERFMMSAVWREMVSAYAPDAAGHRRS